MSGRLLLFGLLLPVACREPAPPVDHSARRAAFHAALKVELGERWESGAGEVLVGADTMGGRAIYHKSCGNCHGTDLRGDGPRAAGMEPAPMPLVGDARAPLPPAALIRIVSGGSSGTPMAPWGRAFTSDQIRDVVAFVWAQKAAAEAQE